MPDCGEGMGLKNAILAESKKGAVKLRQNGRLRKTLWCCHQEDLKLIEHNLL